MGIIRDSFVVLKNWAQAIEALPENEQLETYKALMEYGLTGKFPEHLSPVPKAMLISFSIGMENNIARYNASVENGKKGGRPKTQIETEIITQEEPNINLNETQENLENPNITQPNLGEPNPNLNVNVNDNVNVNVNVNKKEKINKKEKSLDDVLATIEDVGLMETLRQFIKHRKSIKKPLTTYGLELLLKNLNKITPNIFEQVEILNNSIINGWQGVFPLKDGEKGKSSLEDDLARVNEIVGGI